MKKILQKLRYFLAFTAGFVLLGTFVICFTDKIQFHFFLNQQHNRFADIFFKYYTHVGDGAFALILLPFLLFFGKMKNLILAISCCCCAGLLAQILKRVFFSNANRPSFFFEEGALHVVDGVSLYCAYSFPSGHTASAFSFFIFLAFIVRKNFPWQILCAILASLVAFSRVYLSHHFLIDIVFGAIVGICGFFISYPLYTRLKNSHFEKTTIAWIRFILVKHSARIFSLQK